MCVCVLGNKAEILLLVPHPVPPLLLVPPRVQMQLRLWLCRGKLLDRPSLGREEHHPLGHLGLRASEGEAPARDEVQQALRTRREMEKRGREKKENEKRIFIATTIIITTTIIVITIIVVINITNVFSV